MMRRKDMQELQELVRLHRLGTPVRAASDALAMSRNTHKGYREKLDAAALLDGPPEDLPTLEAPSAAVPQRVPRQQLSSAEAQSRSAQAKVHLHQPISLE